MEQSTGKYLILVGILVVLAGIIVYFLGGKLHWMGRLPGDIRIEKENFRFYFPLTTLILVSMLVTLVVTIFRRFL